MQDSQWCYALQDNTIADSPMVELLTSMQHMLEQARVRSGGIGSSSPLHQLVIIVADGRFHEKENLQRVVAVRCDACCCLLRSCHAVPHAKPCSNEHPCCCFKGGFMPSMAWTGAYNLTACQDASVCLWWSWKLLQSPAAQCMLILVVICNVGSNGDQG